MINIFFKKMMYSNAQILVFFVVCLSQIYRGFSDYFSKVGIDYVMMTSFRIDNHVFQGQTHQIIL